MSKFTFNSTFPFVVSIGVTLTKDESVAIFTDVTTPSTTVLCRSLITSTMVDPSAIPLFPQDTSNFSVNPTEFYTLTKDDVTTSSLSYILASRDSNDESM